MVKEKHRKILSGEKDAAKEEIGVVHSGREVIAFAPIVARKSSISRALNVQH